MGGRSKPELKARVTALWLKGLTYAEVARQTGLSRQRVQQIVRPPKPVYDLILARAGGRCQDCGTETPSGHVHHNDHDSEDFNDVDSLVYLCPSCHQRRHPKPKRPKREWPIVPIDVQQTECLRCGHTWYVRRPKLPKVCPKCKRSDWQTPKEK